LDQEEAELNNGLFKNGSIIKETSGCEKQVTSKGKRWKVPLSIKVAIGLFGIMCLIIAIVGSMRG